MSLEGHSSAHDRPQVEKESLLTRTVKRGGPSHCAPGPLGPRGVVNTTLRVVNTTEGD